MNIVNLIMIFRQLFDKTSSTFTYLIASAKGREALIIDPVFENVEKYIVLLNEFTCMFLYCANEARCSSNINGLTLYKSISSRYAGVPTE